MVFLLWLVLLVALIVYIRKTNALSTKVGDLEAEMRQLRNSIGSTTSAAAASPASVGAEEKFTSPAAPAVPAQPRPAVISPTAPPDFPPAQPKPLFPGAPPPRPSRTRAEWEALIGGKLLNRIGALALILGVGFFLKYAFDNNWITETMRVLIGLVIGAGLLASGARTHKKGFQIFAQGLFGAGISILYLSVYASFNFYHLVPQTVAFVLMAIVTVGAFFHALRYDSLAISCLGWAGGFLTPIMLSTGQANEVGLFTYIALLDIGLLAVLLKKDAWIILEPLTLAATYLMYLLWYDKYYQPENLLLTVLFLSIFWGLFYGLDVFRIIKSTKTFAQIRQAVAGFNALFYYAAMYAVIDSSHHNWMGAITLAIGAVYFVTFLALKRRGLEEATTLARYTLTAIVLLILATAIQFDDFITIAFWSVEALILIWCGIHWKMRYVWQAALGLISLALLKLLATTEALGYSPIENFKLILNQRALAFAVLAATLGAGAVLFKRVDEKSSELIRNMLNAGWCVLLFILLTVEANDYFRQRMLDATGETTAVLVFTRFMTWATIWMAYSLPLVGYGLRRKVLPILYGGLGALGLAVIMVAIQGFSFDPISRFTAVLNLRAVVFALVIAGAIVHLRWLKTNRQHYDWIGEVLTVLQVAIVLLILDLLTGETRDSFKRAIFFVQQRAGDSDVSADITRLRNLQQLVLSGVWLLYSVLLMVAGIWRRMQGLRIMAIVLFGVTILKIFIYDLSFLQTLYRIYSFIGLGLILLAVSYLYQRYKAVIFDSAK